ncbi:unnamed protein product [Agarophyton chilense]
MGRGISEALAKDGYDLLITYNTNKGAAEALVGLLESEYENIECATVGGDLALEETRDNVFKEFDEVFAGRSLGVMVHSAGQYLGITGMNSQNLESKKLVFGDGSFVNEDGTVDLSHIKYYQALYGDAYIDLCERALQRMDKSGGSLVGISSPGCNVTMTPRLGYSANGTGKCVMEFVTRSLALPVAAMNVNCNVVVPGWTLTDGVQALAQGKGMSSEQFEASMVAPRVPMGRASTPAEIGAVVAFLCSAAGRNVTGVALPVDGGLHLR